METVFERQVLTTGDTMELRLQHAREVSRSPSPPAQGSAAGPPPQRAAKSITPAVQPKKSRSGKRKPKGALAPPASPPPKPAGWRPGRKGTRSLTPNYGFDMVRRYPALQLHQPEINKVAGTTQTRLEIALWIR